ncbi:MAG: gamma-glutamylcyclotransferase [Ramlibacter sp.]|jgi:gamma-glutamylcyclotransferase (GGCT)/AIG2-like uncharacterized protein YtfP|nr:gamma-glutamylcyclotransferase [Ramlibacter sp.]
MPESPSPAVPRLVFVYGTLRRGESNDITRLAPAPCFVAPGRARGVLYDLGPYPGARFGGDDWVVGEVFAIEAALEQRLDEIEEILPEPTGEYDKRLVTVNLDGGATLPCLVYELSTTAAQGRARIPGGDWAMRASQPR